MTPIPHWVRHGEARLFCQSLGKGPPILATHGFSETGDYWLAGGVAQQLALSHQVVLLDQRGHGRTQLPDTAPRFDLATLMDDLAAVADYFGFERFHLMGHATGSVVAVRLAADGNHRHRLLSLVLTNGASATAMMGTTIEENTRFFSKMARFYEQSDWAAILPKLREKPWPFLHQLDRHPDRLRLWADIEKVFRQNNPATLGAFTRQFYTDPDPQLDALRSIAVPSLVLISEHDDLMRAPSAQIAKAIPAARLVDMPGIGHMTALEAPKDLAAHILEHLTTADCQERRTP
jgi:pimeloyl-ACP methyl ester carboxylesterase